MLNKSSRKPLVNIQLTGPLVNSLAHSLTALANTPAHSLVNAQANSLVNTSTHSLTLSTTSIPILNPFPSQQSPLNPITHLFISSLTLVKLTY